MKSGPVLHRPIPMETRVVVPASMSFGVPRKGLVVGISEFHVIYRYIVLLDEPLATPEGAVRALSVQGTLLEGEDGSNWRIPPRTGSCGVETNLKGNEKPRNWQDIPTKKEWLRKQAQKLKEAESRLPLARE